ncbi:AzlD family protein [Halobellus rufus]|uniref:AzlD family protein n=1 Tax=Halobellus rufus TaxID=1448860 RepID=UPI000679408B|nr:AzlD domain-containing protein [Halobellus rufus]
MADLDPTVVAVIAAMSVATYATKAGGLWLLARIELSERTEAALDVLPGAVVISLLVPALSDLGAPGLISAAAVLVVARRTDGVLPALGLGMVAVVSLRHLL